MLLKTMVRAQTLLKSEKGQSLVEYGLIIALIAVVAIAALTGVGSSIMNKLTGVKDTIDSAGN